MSTRANDDQIKELEVTKAKATDMLRAQDGNITNTLRAYVTSSVA